MPLSQLSVSSVDTPKILADPLLYNYKKMTDKQGTGWMYNPDSEMSKVG